MALAAQRQRPRRISHALSPAPAEEPGTRPPRASEADAGGKPFFELPPRALASMTLEAQRLAKRSPRTVLQSSFRSRSRFIASHAAPLKPSSRSDLQPEA